MEALRADARLRRDLPEVQLNTMEGGVDGRFSVACRAAQAQEES
jgi:hypothetical protein